MRKILGRFEFIRPLGHGSAGGVHLRLDRSLGPEAATQAIPPGGALAGEAPAEPRELPAALLEEAARAQAGKQAASRAAAEAPAAAIRAGLAAPAASGSRPGLVVGRGGRSTCLSLRVALRQAQPGDVRP